MTQALKNIILFSLCVSFCDETSQDNTINSQNAAVESKQISQNNNKIATVSQNKAVNSKNSNLQILANNDKIATVYKKAKNEI